MTRKITRIIAFLAAAMMMVCVLPVPTNTAIAGKDDSGSIQLTGIRSFTDGVFTYTLADDQSATITGFSSQYTGSGEELTVGSTATFNGSTYPVTAVAANAFRNKGNLNITFDGDIRLEGRFSNDSDYDGAFANCNDLTVTFRGQHVSLGPSTFQDCDGLTVRDVYSGDNGFFEAGQKAFAFVKNLKLTTSADVKVSGTSYNVFQGASGEMTFLGGVTNIGGYSFYGCSEGLTITTTLNDTYNWNDGGIGNVDIIINATAENYNKAWPYSGKPKSLTIHCADYIAEISNAGSYGGYWNYQVFMNFSGGIGTIHSNAFTGFRGKNGSVIYIEDNDHHSTTVEENCFPISSDLTVRFNMKKSSINGWAILDKYSYTHFEYLAVDTIPDYRESGKQQMLLSALLNALQVKHPETGDKLTVDEVKSVSFPVVYPTTVQQVSGLILYNRSTDEELRTGTDAGEKNFLLTRDSNFTNLTELTLTLNDKDNTIVEVNKVYNYTAHTNPFLLSDLFRETGYTYSGSIGEVTWNGSAFTVNKNAYWDEQTKAYTDADIYFTNDSPGTVSRLLMLKDSKAIGIFMITQGDDVVFSAAEDDDGIFTIQLGTGGQSAIITGLADGYNGDGNIVIPATIQYQGHAVRVTEIAGEAFDENESRLKSVTFDNGDSPIELGYTAFWGCPNLTEVSGTGLVSIHPNGFAFYRNPLLHSISLRIKEDSPKEYIIYGNGSLTEITLDSDGTMDTVSGKLFFNEPALETLTFLCPVGTLAQGAFKERTIRHLAFNGGIQTIAKEALRNCTTLDSFTAGVLPEDGTTAIGDDAFIGCTSLTNVEIASPITSFGYECFENVPVTSMSFRTSNATIQHYAFAVMPNIKTLVFDGTVKDAEYYAFGYYYDEAGTKLETLIFKGYVTNISSWAYSGNYLKALVFAEGVGTIGQYAFVSNPNASSGGGAFSSNSHLVYIGNSSRTTIGNWAFPYQNINIYCNMPSSAFSLKTDYSNVKYTGDESPDIYLDPTFSGTQYGGFYGTSDVPYHTYAQALDFDIDSAEKQLSNFRKDCISAGITMDLPYDGSLGSNAGYILHIRPDENGEISIPAGTFKGRSKLAGIVIENGNSKDPQKQTTCLTIGKEALAGCTGLSFITFKNESCTVNIGVDGLRGCNRLTSHLRSTQISLVESDAGVATFSNQEVTLGLQLKAKTVGPVVNETALIQQAVSEKIFTEGEQNKVQVRFIDLSLVSPGGNTVNAPAEIKLIQKLGQMTGSDSVKVSKIALYHIENNVPVYVEAQYDQESKPGKIQIGLKADGFSPYALAYTVAGDIDEDGIFTYLLSEDGTATITGYAGGFSGDTINIPETTEIGGKIYQVTGIAEGSLQNPPATIHKIQFNNTQSLSIAENAFSGMTDVTEIVFDNTATIIFADGSAFAGSGSGTVSVKMNHGLNVGMADGGVSAAFSGITGLIDLTIDHDKPISIPADSFRGMTNLHSVTIVPGLTDTGEPGSRSYFYRPDYSIGGIGDGAFAGDTALVSVTVLGQTGKSYVVGNEAFQGCTSLATFEQGDAIRGIGESAFDRTGFSEITLNMDGADLGTGAFDHCANLTDVTFTGTVGTIYGDVFGSEDDDATKLESLIFTEYVTYGTYMPCIRAERLKALVFLKGVYMLSCQFGDNTVYAKDTPISDNLLIYIGQKPNDDDYDPYIDGDFVDNSRNVKAYLNFDNSREDAYQSGGLWRYNTNVEAAYANDTFADKVYVDLSVDADDYQNGSKAYPYGSFEAAHNGMNTELDNARKYRDYFAQAGIDPDALGIAFNEETITSAEYTLILANSNAEQIVTDAFKNDPKLIGVEIHASGDATIQNGAFSGCEHLASLTVDIKSNGSIAIGQEAFKNCAAIESLNMKGLKNVAINDSAFEGCTGLTDITLNHKGTTSIGENAFAGCGELKEVNLRSSSAPTIGKNAFLGTTIDMLRIDGGSENIAEGAAIGGKTYIDGGKTFNANLAKKVGNFETIILTNPQTISEEAQVFGGNEDLKIVYLGKNCSTNGIGGAIFEGMPEKAAALVARKQKEFIGGTKPERENGDVRFLDNVAGKYIDGTNTKDNPDGSENNGFRTFAQAKAYAEETAKQSAATSGNHSGSYYYTEAAKILREALTAAGINFTEDDIRFPLPEEETDGMVFYVKGTVTVSENETWESPENGTMMLLRNEGFTGPMVRLTKGTLSLKNIILDGRNLEAESPLIDSRASGTAIEIHEGTQLVDNNNAYRECWNGSAGEYIGGGAIHTDGSIVMDGGLVSGNKASYGGGIHISGGTFDMSGGSISGNTAYLSNRSHNNINYSCGGGVLLTRHAVMNLRNGEVRDNYAEYGSGAGICLGAMYAVNGSNYGTLYMTGGSIANNTSSFEGAGLYIQMGGKAYVSAGRFIGNESLGGVATPNYGGGAVYVNGTHGIYESQGFPDGELHLSNTLITNNSAGIAGGGISGCGTSTSMIYVTGGSAIYGNTAGDNADLNFDYTAYNAYYGYSYASMEATVSPYMFNGTSYNWIDAETGKQMAESELAYNSYYTVHLRANPGAGAPTTASVIMTGNRAQSRGGAIGSNGIVIIGQEPNPREITVTPQAAKILLNGDMKEGEEYTFSTYLEEYSDYTQIIKDKTRTFYYDYKPEKLLGSKANVTGARKDTKTQISGLPSYTFRATADDLGKIVTLLVVEDTRSNDEMTADESTYLEFQYAVGIGEDGQLTAVLKQTSKGTYKRNEDGTPDFNVNTNTRKVSGVEYIHRITTPVKPEEMVFINTKTVEETTERTVRKEWDDDGNRDGMRPTSIVTTLTADGAFVQQVTLSDANGWAATVRDLPVNKDGKAITYAWTEQEVSGYTQEEVETTGTVTVFTNRVIRVIVEVPPEEPQPEVVQLPKNGRWIPGMIFDDYLTPLGGEWLINHVGDCFD